MPLMQERAVRAVKREDTPMQERLAKGAAGLSIPRWVWIGILVLVAGPGLAVARPKLINWGNSTPINDNLIHDHYHMQRMPFDGGVFHPNPLEQDVFSPDAIPDARVDELIAIMRQTHFTRFTDNFLAIRMFALGNLGDPLYWHSDAQWEVATANLAKMARLAKEGGFKGILLDNEHYSPYRLDAGFRDQLHVKGMRLFDHRVAVQVVPSGFKLETGHPIPKPDQLN